MCNLCLNDNNLIISKIGLQFCKISDDICDFYVTKKTIRDPFERSIFFYQNAEHVRES